MRRSGWLSSNEDYEEKLGKSGLKKTKSRKAILDILIKSNQPISAEQIFKTLKDENIAIDISTVYRTLEALVNIVLVKKINIMNDDRMLFEYNNMDHSHYLVCIGCKKIITIQSCPLGSYEEELENKTNFSILGHKLYLYGYCSECQNNHIGNK
jgi:Fur family ferric uptake transcriptional regulator